MKPPEQLKLHVEKMEKALLQANPWMHREALTDRARKICNSTDTTNKKRSKLIAIIDLAGKALAPYVACHKGCSYCCNLATTISQTEADQIGKHLNRPVVKMPPVDESMLNKGPIDRQKYTGVPCPFLVNSECSIYAIRPVACRTHHSLNESPEQCNTDIPPEKSCVVTYNLHMLDYSVFFLSQNQGEGIADIREFFP